MKFLIAILLLAAIIDSSVSRPAPDGNNGFVIGPDGKIVAKIQDVNGHVSYEITGKQTISKGDNFKVEIGGGVKQEMGGKPDYHVDASVEFNVGK